MSREKDIEELCGKVVGISAREHYNPNGPDYVDCPFCYSSSHIMADMDDIKHDVNCAYLIAKDLSAKP